MREAVAVAVRGNSATGIVLYGLTTQAFLCFAVWYIS